MSWRSPADDNPFADPLVSEAKASGGGGGTGYDRSAPSWLSGGQGGAQPPPPRPPGGSSTQAPGQAAAAPTAAELERQGKVPELIMYTRVVNMFLCILLVVAAVLELLSGVTIAGGVLACYLFAFSCILCCFETHLKVVAKTIAANFGFLYNAKGRTLFLVFIALICFSLEELLSYIAGALMLANAIFNCYVICRYPEFDRDLQRKQLESEGRDYLRANRTAVAQDRGEFARNNPDLAANGTGGAAPSWAHQV